MSRNTSESEDRDSNAFPLSLLKEDVPLNMYMGAMSEQNLLICNGISLFVPGCIYIIKRSLNQE